MHTTPKHRNRWLNGVVVGVVALICSALLGGFVLGAVAKSHHTNTVTVTQTVHPVTPAMFDKPAGNPPAPRDFPGLGSFHHHTSTAHHKPAAAVAPSYTVKPGDTLWGIAGHVDHDPLMWRHLYQVNRGVIGSNPNLIHAGQVLRV